jgi:cellulose synthase/poly-beta-1,6-N-acetylglucosamine synthase-like glycosyltransferase
MLILLIIEKLLIIYFTIYVIIDVFLYISAFGVFVKRKKDAIGFQKDEEDLPFVSIIVPAYNEEVSICLCVKMLLDLNYSNYELIIVNDGSKDNTLSELLNNFSFNPIKENKNGTIITTSNIKNIFSSSDNKLILIDKENGGKADAINAGINISKGKYLCTIDADSILDKEALHYAVSPMERDSSVFVCGGQIALSNELTIENNLISSAKMPKKLLILWQIIEYISTFMVARIGLSKINSLLIMSGAFSVYRKSDLQSVGGFLTRINNHQYILQHLGKEKQTITEDMEIVLRLWKYYRTKKKKAKVVFQPGPVCWTEAPEKYSQLYKQRKRWHQGLSETIWLYKEMIFEPKYGVTGMFAMPYYFFFELLSPLIKTIAVIILPVLMTLGIINQSWVLLFVASTILMYTLIMSSITVIIENWSIKQNSVNREALRYKTLLDWLILLGSGIIANFTYSFYRMFAQLHGMFNFLLKRHNWQKFERKGIQQNGPTKPKQ